MNSKKRPTSCTTITFRCDVTKREEWDSAWKEAEEKLGSVTLLVNNAGVPPEAGWRTCMEVMGKGAFLGTEVAMEKMGREKVRFFSRLQKRRRILSC